MAAHVGDGTSEPEAAPVMQNGNRGMLSLIFGVM